MIAEHACLEYSGIIGLSASAKDLFDEAVDLAVIERIRHNETEYDKMLLTGISRNSARHEIQDKVKFFLPKWSKVQN